MPTPRQLRIEPPDEPDDDEPTEECDDEEWDLTAEDEEDNRRNFG